MSAEVWVSGEDGGEGAGAACGMIWVDRRVRRSGQADVGIEKADCVVRRGMCGVNAQVCSADWAGGKEARDDESEEAVDVVEKGR